MSQPYYPLPSCSLPFPAIPYHRYHATTTLSVVVPGVAVIVRGLFSRVCLFVVHVCFVRKRSKRNTGGGQSVNRRRTVFVETAAGRARLPGRCSAPA